MPVLCLLPVPRATGSFLQSTPVPPIFQITETVSTARANCLCPFKRWCSLFPGFPISYLYHVRGMFIFTPTHPNILDVYQSVRDGTAGCRSLQCDLAWLFLFCWTRCPLILFRVTDRGLIIHQHCLLPEVTAPKPQGQNMLVQFLGAASGPNSLTIWSITFWSSVRESHTPAATAATSATQTQTKVWGHRDTWNCHSCALGEHMSLPPKSMPLLEFVSAPLPVTSLIAKTHFRLTREFSKNVCCICFWEGKKKYNTGYEAVSGNV